MRNHVAMLVKERFGMRGKVKEKKRTMKFRERTQSKKGIEALLLSVISIVGFIVLCIVSTLCEGQAPMLVGSIAIVLAFLCMVAFWLAIGALKEKEISYGIPIIGIILSGVQFIVFLCLYMIGIF